MVLLDNAMFDNNCYNSNKLKLLQKVHYLIHLSLNGAYKSFSKLQSFVSTPLISGHVRFYGWCIIDHASDTYVGHA